MPQADSVRGRIAPLIMTSIDRGGDAREPAREPSATERVEGLARARVAAALAVEACVGVTALNASAPSLDPSDPRVRHFDAAMGDYASTLRSCGVALGDALQDVAQLVHASVAPELEVVLVEAALAPVIAAYVPAGQPRDI